MKLLVQFLTVSIGVLILQTTDVYSKNKAKKEDEKRAVSQVSSGGSMDDCQIPRGPIAYNIGSGSGAGAQCKNVQAVVVGFTGHFHSLPKDIVGMGYINPLVENKEMQKKFGVNKSNSKMGNATYKEPQFHDYSIKNARDYIAFQVEHWQKAARPGQKCVAVDVDNCDVIGTKNYAEVLKVIKEMNAVQSTKKDGVQVKVLVKNPQVEACSGFMQDSVVVGAFIEEIDSAGLTRLLSARSNKNQILLFAKGNDRDSSHLTLDQIANNKKISNVAVSFDVDGEYTTIDRCTYH